MAFERVDTKSPAEAVEILFSRAIPSLPVLGTDEISRICRNDLNYDIRHGDRHATGTAEQLKPVVAWNLEKAPRLLPSGQRVVSYQVSVQPQLQFATLALVIGDGSGTPGYMFGARVWRTESELFTQGWEGFQTAPPVALPKPVATSTPDAAPADLIAKLGSESWDVRAAAAELLGERHDLRALDSLIRILKERNEDTTVKESAAKALQALGDGGGIAAVDYWEQHGRPVFMDFGPDDPESRRRKQVREEARAKVKKARANLERSASEGAVSTTASSGSENARQRPWWKFW